MITSLPNTCTILPNTNTITASTNTGPITSGNVYSSSYYVTSNPQYIGKTEDEEIADKLKRLMRFRDLKIMSIKDLGDGDLEITLIRKRKYFKIKITGKLVLENIKGEELDALGKLPYKREHIKKFDDWDTYTTGTKPYIVQWSDNTSG